MDHTQKLVWHAGMILTNHHLQQWDHFNHEILHTRMQGINVHSWGLLEVEIGTDTLENGQIKVTRCVGVMPDGYVFNIPERDGVPPIRVFSDFFSSTRENMSVYLTLPSERQGVPSCSLGDSDLEQEIRFQLKKKYVSDENIGYADTGESPGSRDTEISIAQPNFRIKFEDESLEDTTHIKICQIDRTPDGEFALSQNYIPPCLAINASENLMRIIGGLLEFLIARCSVLRDRRSQLPSGKLEINMADIPLYWLLNAVNAVIPVLNQYNSLGRIHPQEVYTLLLSLSAQLTTFSIAATIQPKDLPPYEHINSYPGFSELDRGIRQLLSDITPAKNYREIELEKRGESIFVGRIQETSILTEAELFIVFNGELAESQFVNDLPKKMRVASPAMIKKVLAQAIPALTVKPVSRPPAGVPIKPEAHYMKLEKKGSYWNAIEDSKSLVIFVPGDFKQLNLELIAVFPDR